MCPVSVMFLFVQMLLLLCSCAQVPAGRAKLVPVSLELGFELHHAEKAYIMLNM